MREITTMEELVAIVNELEGEFILHVEVKEETK